MERVGVRYFPDEVGPAKKIKYLEQELVIITKAYDLILWMLNHTQKFPKSLRFSVSVRIECYIILIM